MMAAGALDVLWHLPSYERLVAAWGMDPGDATAAVLRAIDLVATAIRTDDPPHG